jgi:outer membrane receptor protein involved in Fe transport
VAAIDGVEIITGGAGATYGADAVAGVVNFRLKKNFTGIELDAQYGETFRGDGAQYRVSDWSVPISPTAAATRWSA